MIKDSPEIAIYFPDFKPNELPKRDYIVSMICPINHRSKKDYRNRSLKEKIYINGKTRRESNKNYTKIQRRIQNLNPS